MEAASQAEARQAQGEEDTIQLVGGDGNADRALERNEHGTVEYVERWPNQTWLDDFHQVRNAARPSAH